MASTKIDEAVLAQAAPGRPTDFFVLLKSRPELGRARAFDTHAERTRFVYDTVKGHADRAQSGLRELLVERKAAFTPYWIANAVKVTGDESLALDIAARDEVDRIVPDRRYELVRPEHTASEASPRGVEWNIDRIRAPEVWDTFDDRGEGIVVGTIDTGAQFDHPAIARQYRGASGGTGVLDHAYSWYDPSQICGTPSVAPCDNIGHGTHVLGTIVGDDGQGNQTGAAPGATWIAAKGCETDFCSTTALLASGQWMLAPTDVDGSDPRPDLAPHVINNSWGGASGDPMFRQVVGNWVAAGIFPVFAIGNAGPGCGSAQSPGDFPESYGVGAFDVNDALYAHSARGPSSFGVTKPDVTAPGVNVRSSVPGGRYEFYTGTSMATPHVTGTVALLWSAAPNLVGDLADTRALLDGAAVATDDSSCGGTPEFNNVWGHGRLDAFEAVSQAPRGPVGTLTGVVRSGDKPLTNAEIRVEGPLTRTTRTDDAGEYRLRLSVGRYDLTVREFGYLDQTTQVEVTENETVTRDFDLAPAPRRTVSGHVREATGTVVAGAKVTVPGTPIPAVTSDDTGAYQVPDVPEGHYDLLAAATPCLVPDRRHVHVTGDTTVDFTLPVKSDDYGHECTTTTPSWVPANTLLPVSGSGTATSVRLPFPVNLYGQSYTTAHVHTGGFLSFTGRTLFLYDNSPIPSRDEPNTAIYVFWDNVRVDAAASVRTEVVGAAPNRSFVVEWRNVMTDDTGSQRVSFEVLLAENGRITLQYQGIGDQPVERGASATVGIENETGTDALQYSNNAPVLSDDIAIQLRVPGTGLVRGTVTDADDDQPIPRATVTVTQDGTPDQTVTADENGIYQARVKTGDVHLRIEGRHYTTVEADLRVDGEDDIAVRDAVLRTGRLETRTDALEIVVPPGQTRQRTVTVTNTGTVDVAWQTKEAGGAAARPATPRALPEGTAGARTTQGLPASDTIQPATAGEVIRSWPATGVRSAWGVGYRDGPWISDQDGPRNAHFTDDGVPDRLLPAPWAGYWVSDLTQIPDRSLVCQLNIAGTHGDGIYCWHPDTGELADHITGSFPWTATEQRGLAYRPDDDSFYVGGWDGVIYHVQGLSHSDRGTVTSRCSPADPNIAGLGWNTAFGVLWMATNSAADNIYAINPDTCQTLRTISPPDNAAYTGAGLETDPAGNLWTVSQGNPATVYQIDGGVPDFSEVPWLRATPGNGTLRPGESGKLTVEVDTTGLAPGVYGASVVLASTSGRTPAVAVPVRLVVPAHQVGVNAGGTAHRDGDGDAWATDRAYTAGGYGYLDNNRSRVVRTTTPINGTGEQPLFGNQREGAYEYRFDNVPDGVYAIELDLAELRRAKPNTRLFDVIAEDSLLIPALDVAGEAGSYTALTRTVYVTVTDGQLNIRFISRKGDPIINAIRITHRPDRTS